jgi:hypothetical protein
MKTAARDRTFQGPADHLLNFQVFLWPSFVLISALLSSHVHGSTVCQH